MKAPRCSPVNGKVHFHTLKSIKILMNAVWQSWVNSGFETIVKAEHFTLDHGATY